MVNLDAEKGRTPRAGRDPDIAYCVIRPSKIIRMAVIQGYLSRQMPFDNSVLEAISRFLNLG
jgi:eukaryotic translation initiation factor 2C